jgi:large subunit ribosomal protein L24
MKIKKGDTVKILYGKDSGKRGVVVAVDLKSDKLLVEGLNLYKRHLKGDGKTRTSEIVIVEKPYPVSKVMLICPSCDKSTRIGIKKEGDKILRVCKKCGKTVEPIVKEEVKKETKKKTKSVKKENNE